MTISKTMSIGKRSMDDWTDWGVVDERSGGSQNFGCSSDNSGVSLGITLGNNVSGSGYKTMSIGKRSVDDWTDWCVVDERSWGSQNFGCSSDNSGVSVSRPLAKVMPSISQTMISISDGKGVGSNFSSNLSWSFNDSFYNWNMGNCSNCGQSITQSMVSQWKSGIT